MSEKLHTQEYKHHKEQKETQAEKSQQKENLNELLEKAEEAKNDAEDRIESIRSSIEKESHKGEKTDHAAQEKADDVGTVVIDRKAKTRAYKKELGHIRRKLTTSEKGLSKVIHARPVEVVSEYTGKTLARPSGLLGGGLFALLGTSVIYWMSHHYGFAYNNFVFIAFLIGGFFIGLIAEVFWRTIRRSS